MQKHRQLGFPSRTNRRSYVVSCVLGELVLETSLTYDYDVLRTNADLLRRYLDIIFTVYLFTTNEISGRHRSFVTNYQLTDRTNYRQIR